MPEEKKKKAIKKGEIDHEQLIEKYGHHEAPDFQPMIKTLLSKPNPKAPIKIPKR